MSKDITININVKAPTFDRTRKGFGKGFGALKEKSAAAKDKITDKVETTSDKTKAAIAAYRQPTNTTNN